MPTCRPIRDGIREVRASIKDGRVEARTYGIDNGIILLRRQGWSTGRDQTGSQALEKASGTIETVKEDRQEEKEMSDLKSSIGGTLEDFFDELGEKEEIYGEAIKRVLTWQIEEARKKQSITKSDLGEKSARSS